MQPLDDGTRAGRQLNNGANFGAPLNPFAFTTPRMFRLSAGLRFRSVSRAAAGVGQQGILGGLAADGQVFAVGVGK